MKCEGGGIGGTWNEALLARRFVLLFSEYFEMRWIDPGVMRGELATSGSPAI